MTDERFFTLARLHGFEPDRALREFAEAIEAEARPAPELLAVLQDVAAYWAGGDVPAELDARMRAAIVKATGEA